MRDTVLGRRGGCVTQREWNSSHRPRDSWSPEAGSGKNRCSAIALGGSIALPTP